MRSVVPELPDVTIYLEALERYIGGRRLDTLRLASPFVLRTVSPSPAELEGRIISSLAGAGFDSMTSESFPSAPRQPASNVSRIQTSMDSGTCCRRR
jgi:hypothetical protein